jgi:hypothetical protein
MSPLPPPLVSAPALCGTVGLAGLDVRCACAAGGQLVLGCADGTLRVYGAPPPARPPSTARPPAAAASAPAEGALELQQWLRCAGGGVPSSVVTVEPWLASGGLLRAAVAYPRRLPTATDTPHPPPASPVQPTPPVIPAPAPAEAAAAAGGGARGGNTRSSVLHCSRSPPLIELPSHIIHAPPRAHRTHSPPPAVPPAASHAASALASGAARSFGASGAGHTGAGQAGAGHMGWYLGWCDGEGEGGSDGGGEGGGGGEGDGGDGGGGGGGDGDGGEGTMHALPVASRSKPSSHAQAQPRT